MKTEKFDTVRMMRKVRDEMSRDMENMSFEERKAYIERRSSKMHAKIEAREQRKAG